MSHSLAIWNDLCIADLRAAGPSALLVASFLKYKANSIGFFQVEPEKISHAVGLSLEEIESTLTVLEKIGFVRHHANTQMFWIIGHARMSLGHIHANNRKMIAQANAEFAATPKDCPLRVDFLWQHALMLRLEIQGAAPASELSLVAEDDVHPDLLPKISQHLTSGELSFGREI